MKIVGLAIRAKSGAPMQEIEEAQITQTEGVLGDSRGKFTNRQITVLSLQQWREACEDVNIALPWTFRRANILISGNKFSKHDVSKIITIGDIKLQITEETEPCNRMDAQYHGLTKALKPNWRAGVCCKVLTGGQVRLGDKAELAIVTSIT